jgi:hypothetical protein
MKVAVCIEKFEGHGLTFREGETYLANMVNPNYWVVESVGIKSEDFLLHFEVVDELKEDKISGSTTEVNKRFVEEEEMFKEILKSFGYDDEIEDIENNKLEEKETWLDKLRDYIFA